MKHHGLFVIISFIITMLFFDPQANALASFSLFSSHKNIKATQGEVRIPVKKINDGKAHYYKFKNGDSTIKFFVVKSRDGFIRAAFDACDVCVHAKKGYSQDGDFMICNNCGMRFHSSRINVVKGGCNPAPLNRKVVSNTLIIKAEDIVKGTYYFPEG